MFNSLILWLRERFIPSEENGDRPAFLRTGSVQVVLFALFGVQAIFLVYTYVVLPSSASLSAIFASVLIDQTNQERAKFDVPILTQNEELTRSAQAKANDMAERGYFAHYTPEGDAPWKFIKEAGYQYRTAGENLAVNFVDSRDVTDAWMNSPTHRANLLAAKYTEVGIATARGTYKGREAIFVVQHFGTPLVARVEKPSTVATVSGTQVETAPKTPGIPVVAGVSTTASATRLAGADAPTKVLGISTDDRPSLLVRLMTQPRKLSELVQFGIAFLSLLALLLAFFIRIRIQHPIILANGVMLLAVSTTLALVNVLITRGAI